MDNRASLAVVTTVVLSVLGLTGAPVAAAAASASVAVQGRSPLATPSNLIAAAPSSAQVDFSVGLQMRNRAGAIALEQAVSEPSSPRYRQFLSTSAWEQQFSPTQASVDAVSSWLASQGITVQSVTPDRMTINAKASAASIERTFGAGLGVYRTADGQALRLASSALLVPSNLAPLISGIVGVSQQIYTHGPLTNRAAGATQGRLPAARRTVRGSSRAADEEPIPPPAGIRNAPPCSTYFGEKRASSLPGYGTGWAPLTWSPCGYVPAQLQGAYNLAQPIAAGVNGAGVTVAIVDAYASPTLQKDAEEYSRRNEPSAPLSSSDFSEMLSPKYTEEELCEPSEWSVEQTLDVEAVHATAPGAKILYVGAENCEAGLFSAVQKVVDEHLAQVISGSWGSRGGELGFERIAASERQMFDSVLVMADDTGIGVQFAAGDEGSYFTLFGANVPDYPAVSPYATAVGGTTLEVSKQGTRAAEYGWSTSSSVLCTKLLLELAGPGCRLGGWTPQAPGEYIYGGGGGTSYVYAEPSYQLGVVPATLAARNTRITKQANRVEPDISADAAPETGMKIGETRTFADGTYYSEVAIGGTSLASPLLAGVVADADQAVGGPGLGFINPLIYNLRASSSPKRDPGAFYDVLPAGKQATAFNVFLNNEDSEEGVVQAANAVGFEGLEAYCSGTEECEVQTVALHATPGFDSMTGVGSPGPEFVQALSSMAKAASARP